MGQFTFPDFSSKMVVHTHVAGSFYDERDAKAAGDMVFCLKPAQKRSGRRISQVQNHDFVQVVVSTRPKNTKWQ